MPRDLHSIGRAGGELLTAALGSRAARDAGRRRVERSVRSVLRRLRNAALTVVILFAALIVASIATGGLGLLTWIMAIPTVFLAALIVLLWPSRSRREASAGFGGDAGVPLDRLAERTEEWLIDTSARLPREAGPALDRIVDRLRDLQPALARTEAASGAAGDARRLIGAHLPSLVDSYLALPPGGVSAPDQRALAASLATVADELDDLCERVGCERRIGFETERRFIETRYRDDDSLSPRTGR